MARALIAAALAALVVVPAAGAQTSLAEVAQSLRSDVVYVHPEADVISASEARSLREQIDREAGGPLFIAILPASYRGDGSSTEVAIALGRLARVAGIYAVVVGNQFRAVSTDLASGEAARLATEAFESRRDDGVAAVLADFVSRVGEARAGQRDEEGSNFWLVGLVVGGVALLGFTLVRRRRRAAELAEVKAAARDDLVALADDVTELEAKVERDPEAKRSYARAIEAYQRADDVFDRAGSTRELAKVSSAIAEGRFEMEAAKAQLEGRPPPEPRVPCFFDPRHGPSTQDVWWEPPYGRAVMVPAYFGPWAGGFYGGVLPGFLVGTALGATMGAPDTYAAPTDDFGGGDFSGGDFGGGDFGGGGDF